MQTTQRVSSEERRCFCGHILRAPTELAKGWCLECGMQAALNQATIDQLSQMPGLDLIAHLARKAAVAEIMAVTRSERTPERRSQPSFFSAYEQCEALSSVAEALTQWAFASARLWLLQEEEQDPERKAALAGLHQWTTRQFKRLFTIHLTMQARLSQFCGEHHIPVTFKIADEALNIASQPAQPQFAEAIACAK